jgi:hypothetical protein
MPSQAELAFQQYQARKEALTHKTKADVLTRYGNAAEPADDSMRALAATESYAEYDASGAPSAGHLMDVCLLNQQEEGLPGRLQRAVWSGAGLGWAGAVGSKLGPP